MIYDTKERDNWTVNNYRTVYTSGTIMLCINASNELQPCTDTG